MGIIRSQSIKTTGALLLGMVVGMINQIFLQTQVLSTDQIGLVGTLNSAAMILLAFTTLGMPSVCVRFWPSLKTETEKDKFVTLTTLVPLFGLIGVLLLLWLPKEWVLETFYSDTPLMRSYWYIIIPFAVFQTFFMVWNFYSRNQLRTTIPNALKEIGIRVVYAGLLILLILKIIDFPGLMDGYAITHIIILGVLVWYVNRLRKIRFNFQKPLISPELKKSIPSFAAFSMLTVLGTHMVGHIDRVMLSSMANLSETGIYTVAFFMGAVIDAPVRSMLQITAPVYAKAWENNDMKEIGRVYAKSCITLLILGVLLFVGIWINLDNIFDIIPNGELFITGKEVVFYIALGKVVSMGMGTSLTLLGNSNHYKVNFYALLALAVMAIGSNAIFIPIMGIQGAAIASTLSLVTYKLIQYFFIWFKFGLQPFNGKTLLTLGVGAVILLLGVALPKLDNAWLDLIYRSLIVLFTYGGLVLALRLSEEVNHSFFGFLGMKDPFKR